MERMIEIMKKEWNDSELKQVTLLVKKWINSRKFVTRHDGLLGHIRTVAELDEILGLAYTSSSRAACTSICNTELYLDDNREYIIRSFEMNDYGTVFAVCHDCNENELLIPINR